MDKVTGWREELHQYLKTHGVGGQRREETCAVWQANHKITQEDMEQFLTEIESIVERGE
jgi:hypothetical protein